MSAKATFWAWDQTLASSGQKMVLLCLSDCHNPDTNLCNPSVDYISHKTHLDRKTVMKSLKELESIGVISVKRYIGNGNKYTLHFDRASHQKQTHFVYKTTDEKTGEYYIGVHRCYKLNDGYKGSGTWVEQHPNFSQLTLKIVHEFADRERAEGAELAMIAAFIDDPKCMNKKTTRTKSGTTKNGIARKRDSPKTEKSSTNFVLKGSQKRDTNLKESKKNLKQYSFSKWPNDPGEDTWTDYQKHRKAKRAPITQTSVDRMGVELYKLVGAGWTVDQALSEQMARGWQGLKADWLLNSGGSYGKPKESLAERSARQTAEALARIEAEEANSGALGANDELVRPQVGKPGRPPHDGERGVLDGVFAVVPKTGSPDG